MTHRGRHGASGARLPLAMVLLTALATPAMAEAQAGAPTSAVPAAASPRQNPLGATCPPTASNPYDYVIGQGDILKVLVWKEPDLSGEVRVRSDGQITIPLAGDVVAWGRNPAQVTDLITEKLSKFVEAPTVTVTVLQPQSQRFFVIGQVGKTGEFPLLTRTTVLQALAMAGGFGTFAKRDEILIVHDRGRPNDIHKVNYKEIESGRTESNIPLEPGDTVVVP